MAGDSQIRKKDTGEIPCLFLFEVRMNHMKSSDVDITIMPNKLQDIFHYGLRLSCFDEIRLLDIRARKIPRTDVKSEFAIKHIGLTPQSTIKKIQSHNKVKLAIISVMCYHSSWNLILSPKRDSYIPRHMKTTLLAGCALPPLAHPAP